MDIPTTNQPNPAGPAGPAQSSLGQAAGLNASAPEPEQVKQLTDQLMADLGLSQLSQTQKDEIMAKIRQRVMDTIFLTMLENLSDQDTQALEDKLKAGTTDEQALEWLVQKVPNYADKFAAALAKLYQDLKQSTGQ